MRKTPTTCARRIGLSALGLSILALSLACGCGKGETPVTQGAAHTGGEVEQARDHEMQVDGNTTIERFREAKGHVMDITRDRRETFYCGCRFDEDKAIDHASCGYTVRKNKKRVFHSSRVRSSARSSPNRAP